VKIREASPVEYRTLSALALRSKAHWSYSTHFLNACREELTVSEHRSANEPVFVAEDGQQLLGFYSLDRLDEKAWELGHLFVEPSAIGRGIGRALFDHALSSTRKLGGARLIVQGDPHAEGFYLKMGAQRLGSRPSQSIVGRQLPRFEVLINGTNPRPHGAR
jgi:predicted N-acetyltransferase YhbS